MTTTVKVLTMGEINDRYPKESRTRMAKLTREAITLGHSIAFIEKKGLATSSIREREIQWALESLYPRAFHRDIHI